MAEMKSIQKRADLNSQVRDYWNKNVFNWKIASAETGSEEFFRETERYRFAKLEYLERRVDFGGFAGKRLLDVGCGLGNDLSRFVGGGALGTGIDISPVAIELSKKNFQHRKLKADFYLMDGEQMTFDDCSFDVVYCHTVLHFTPNPEAMIEQIYRVLKPGGLAIIMTINRYSWLYFLHRLAKLKIDYLDAPVFNKYSIGEFEDMLSSFDELDIVVERFPVPTEVHTGLKALIYNKVFVGFFNALPRSLTRRTGYHLLAFATREQ